MGTVIDSRGGGLETRVISTTSHGQSLSVPRILAAGLLACRSDQAE